MLAKIQINHHVAKKFKLEMNFNLLFAYTHSYKTNLFDLVFFSDRKKSSCEKKLFNTQSNDDHDD